MEVVRLTTTAAKTTPSDTTTEPESRIERGVTALKRMWFPALLAVAVIIAAFILGIVGLTNEPDVARFTYPNTMGLIVGLYSLVIFAWPAMMAITKKAWLRLVLMAIVVVIVFLLLPMGVRILGMVGLAQALWGLRVFGLLALALQALAAYWLTRYTVRDDTLDKDRKGLPELDKKIVEVDAKLTSAKANEKARKSNLKSKQAAQQAAAGAAKKASITLKSAQEAYDESEAKNLFDTLTEARDNTKRLMGENADKSTEIAKTLTTATQKNVIDKLERTQKELEEDYDTLRVRLEAEEVNLSSLKWISGVHALKASLKTATAASADKDKILKSADEHQEIAETEHKKAAQRATSKGKQLKTLQSQRENLKRRIEAADESAKKGRLSPLVIPAILLAGALVLYSSWYGQVLVERAV